MQDIILLKCADCNNKNYSTTKNKKNTTEKLSLKKFCNHCRKHVLHKETKA